MFQTVGHDTDGGGLLARKGLWIGVGAAVFVLIGFIVPAPESITFSASFTINQKALPGFIGEVFGYSTSF